jgi:predicted GTPase
MKWKAEIDSKVVLPDGRPIPVVLLGNKCDLENASIDAVQLKNYLQENRFAGELDVSAKDNKNVMKAARCIHTQRIK